MSETPNNGGGLLGYLAGEIERRGYQRILAARKK